MAALLRLAALWWISLVASGAQALIPVGTPAVLPAGVSDLAVVAGKAYAVGNDGVEIFDASDPERGYTRLGGLPGAFERIEVRGDLAYLTSNFGLHIADVSDPASPVEVGFHSEFPASRDGLALDVAGPFVLLARGARSPRVGLRIIDVSNPAAPVPRGDLPGIDLPIPGMPFPLNSELSIVREGHTAFLVHSLGGAAVVDVSDPDAPALVTTFSFPGAPSGAAAVHRGSLFLQGETPSEESNLLIYDVSDAAAPAPLASIEHLFCVELAVARGIAYCANSFPYPFGGIGLQLFDVSDAANPSELGFLLVDGFASGLAVSDGFAHVSAIPAGVPMAESLQAIDVRVPEFPQRALTGQGGYEGIALESERLYGAGFAPDRFDVLDVSTRLAPILLGSVGLRPSFGADVEVSGGTAYVVVGAGIVVLDVSDAANPRVVTTLPRAVLERAAELETSGGRLYIATLSGSIEIHDIGATPAAPHLLGSLALAGRIAPHDLDILGGRLFVTSRNGISIVDVVDPAAPREIGRIDNPVPHPSAGFGNAAVAGDVLYLNETPVPLGLALYDVSDPAQPHRLGVLQGAASDYDFEVEGDRLFVGANRVYDVSTPQAPRLLGQVFGDLASDIAVASTVVYAAGGAPFRSPLFVTDFGPEYLPTLEVDIDIRPGDRHNRVLLGRPHALVVALLGSTMLDVRQVDRRALALGPDGATALISVPALVNRDRKKDLLSVFWTPDTGIAFGDTEVCLEGRLETGRRLRGCDEILTHTGCGRGYELALVVPLCVPLARAARRLRRTQPIH